MEKREEILVEVNGLSKKFCFNLKQSLVYGLSDVAAAAFRIRRDRSQLRKGEFWAVKDISFRLKRGECLGLIGPNGAGKSTLLKMLNGLIEPDEGSIVMRGKIGALIELGAGFNPLLTGRENIYINGQLLGFSKKEIDGKMQDIIGFSEIGEFIDTPVQNYSSGMKVRLGFAVAAQMEPDVLIIDEVLAVGDLGFVLKCFNRVDSLLRNTAVIFVSHSMPQVSRISTQILLMEKGRTGFLSNDVAKGIDMYYSRFAGGNSGVVFERGEEAALISLKFGNDDTIQEDKYSINRLEDLRIVLDFRIKKKNSTPHIIVTINDKEAKPVGMCQNAAGLSEKNILRTEGEDVFYRTALVIPRINLSKGIYSVSVSVMEEFRSKPLLRVQSAGYFQVFSPSDVWPPIEFEGIWS